MHRVGSLEIDQDLSFERREWTVQRVGWLVFLFILVLGFAGFLGSGPVSHVEASAGPLTVAYERFTRERASSEVEIRLSPGAAPNGEVALWLDQAYLNKVDLVRIRPEPARTDAAADRIVFRFLVENPDQPNQVTLQIQPSEPGRTEGRIGLVDGPEVAIDQFIFP